MESTLPVGEPAPNFSLPDLDGKVHTLAGYRDQVVVINFWSAECPWSKRADELIAPALAHLSRGVVLLSIASNANETAEALAYEAGRRRISPVLLDLDQAVADLYQAQATPHYFLIDRGGTLRFQGPPDDATFRQREAGRDYLIPAVEAVLAGRTPEFQTVLPYGCAIVRFPLG
jgi:peroxiredoxin